MNMLRAGFYDGKVRTVDCIPPDDGEDDAASDSSGRSSRTGSGRSKFASPNSREQPPSPGKDAVAASLAPPSPASPVSPLSPLSAAPGAPTPAGPRPSSPVNGGRRQPQTKVDGLAEAADTAAARAANSTATAQPQHGHSTATATAEAAEAAARAANMQNIQTWEDAMLALDLSSELGYLSQVVLRLFERYSAPGSSPARPSPWLYGGRRTMAARRWGGQTSAWRGGVFIYIYYLYFNFSGVGG